MPWRRFQSNVTAGFTFVTADFNHQAETGHHRVKPAVTLR